MTIRDVIIGYILGLMILIFSVGATVLVIKEFNLKNAPPKLSENSIFQAMQKGNL